MFSSVALYKFLVHFVVISYCLIIITIVAVVIFLTVLYSYCNSTSYLKKKIKIVKEASSLFSSGYRRGYIAFYFEVTIAVLVIDHKIYL